jgi:hypothetical protein
MARSVTVPGDVTLWQEFWGHNTVEEWVAVGITQIRTEDTWAETSKTYTLEGNRVNRTLYVPLSFDRTVTEINPILALTTALAEQAAGATSSLQFYDQSAPYQSQTLLEAAAPLGKVPIIEPGVILYVPYGFDKFAAIPLTPQVAVMREAARNLPSASSTTSTTKTSSGSQTPNPQTTLSSSAADTNDNAASANPNGDITDIVEPTATTGSQADSGKNSGTPAPTGDSDNKKPDDQTKTRSELNAAAAGGVVGGFFAGAFICALLIWLLRRHKRQKRAVPRYSRHDESTPGHVPETKERHDLAIPMSVTGWQKHLPQEKDDGTIARTVKTVFDQVQVHMEGFYKPKSDKLTEEAMAAIKRISPPDLARKLGRAPDSVSLLEAILVRWIVQRMSLRSVAAESFLPVEYTKIPEQNGWHMENDENGNVHAAEGRKGQ